VLWKYTIPYNLFSQISSQNTDTGFIKPRFIATLSLYNAISRLTPPKTAGKIKEFTVKIVSTFSDRKREY
jgi:hypothetical protein